MKINFKYVLSTAAMVALVSTHAFALDLGVYGDLIGSSYSNGQNPGNLEDSKKAPSFEQTNLRLTASGAVNSDINGTINTSLVNSGIVVDEAYLTTDNLFKAVGLGSIQFVNVGAEAGKRRVAFGRLNQAYFNDLSSVSKPLAYNLINAGEALTTQGLFLNFGLGKAADLQVGYSTLSGRNTGADENHQDAVVNIPQTGVRANDNTASVINARLTGAVSIVKLGASLAAVNNNYSVVGEQNNTFLGLDASVTPLKGLTVSSEYLSSTRQTKVASGEEAAVDIKYSGYYVAASYDLTKTWTLGTRVGALSQFQLQADRDTNGTKADMTEFVLNATRALSDTASIKFEYKGLTTPNGNLSNSTDAERATTRATYTVQVRFAIK